MKRLLRVKILVLLAIICVGTYMLTKSVAITLGVAILMYVLDSVVGAWADKKDKEYFYNDETGDDGETD